MQSVDRPVGSDVYGEAADAVRGGVLVCVHLHRPSKTAFDIVKGGGERGETRQPKQAEVVRNIVPNSTGGDPGVGWRL